MSLPGYFEHMHTCVNGFFEILEMAVLSFGMHFYMSRNVYSIQHTVCVCLMKLRRPLSATWLVMDESTLLCAFHI